MQFSPKPYKKDHDYSYTLGAYPTVELLKTRPSSVIKVFLSEQLAQGSSSDIIMSLCTGHNIPIETNDKLFRILSPKENCFVIGAFYKYPSRIENKKNHIILVNPGDMGNAGTIIRAASGFGFDNIGIISPGADIYNPKAVRASMGAIFSAETEYFDSFEQYRSAHTDRDIYPFMTDGAVYLDEIKPDGQRPFSLVFGNESSGLPAEYKKIGKTAKIRQTDKIDSLNLTVAASIAMYVFSAANFAIPSHNAK